MPRIASQFEHLAYLDALEFVLRSGDAVDDPYVADRMSEHVLNISRNGEKDFLQLTREAIRRYRDQRQPRTKPISPDSELRTA